MAHFKWNDDLSVGVEDLDDDHKVLMGLMNDLYNAIKEGKGKDIAGDVLESLRHYTSYHFRREEAYFKQTDYPQAEEHKMQHKDLILKVLKIKEQSEDSSFALDTELIQLLGEWLDEHIQQHDKQYSAHLKKHGIV